MSWAILLLPLAPAIRLFTDVRDGFNVDAADVWVAPYRVRRQNHGFAGNISVVGC